MKYTLRDDLWRDTETYKSIDEAIKAVDRTLGYTQRDVYLAEISDDGTLTDIMVARWYGVNPEEDDDVLMRFGDFGFYSNFVDLD